MLIKENSSILIPIDFSKQSLIAIEQSYNLAKFTKSKIIVSGFQVVGKTLKAPSNVKVIKEFAEMAELAANC